MFLKQNTRNCCKMLEGRIRCGKNGFFRDEQGRSVQLKGINVDGGSKFPKRPDFPSHRRLVGKDGDLFYEGDSVSFVGRPFPLDEVEHHIRRIKRMGYNSIRYIITWEALEHAGPGKYDEEFIEYTVEVLKIIDRIGGVYAYLDPHQDVWSRYSGGDGAPLWTLFAAGLNPRNFEVTEAAMIENTFPKDPKSYPKMLWTTNYKRLAAGTMFVLFFAGERFAPKCIINGVNIQHYLQRHFIAAFAHLLKRIKALAPHLLERTLLGIETINEPNCGYLTTPNISEVPTDYQLRIGTCPSILQSLKLGVGIPVEVDEYRISITGPKKIGKKLVDPKGTSVWLDTDKYDELYGFQRDAGWKLGQCLWEQHGVWDSKSQIALIPDYFFYDQDSNETVDEAYFIENFFVDFYQRFRKAMRAIQSDVMIFIQPPPLQEPPHLKGTDLIDENTVFCPHYYDGMSLMFKTWNKTYNVDTLGVVRRRYLNPVFGIVFGETAIRNSFKRQLREMKEEGQRNLGEDIPVIFSETGMPFDMDDKKAYENDDFSSQTSALDAISFALESSNISHSWWCYTANNCHKWGDRFNCEDFSFWSKDDDIDESLDFNNYNPSSSKPVTRIVIDRKEPQYSSPGSSGSDSAAGSTLIGSHQSDQGALLHKYNDMNYNDDYSKPSHDGIRAIDAVVRPYCVALNGEFIDSSFDLENVTYTLKIKGSKNTSHPTRIYLPRWHFDYDDIKIDITSGFFEMEDGSEVLEWHHDAGEGTITISSVKVQKMQSGWSSLFCCKLFCSTEKEE